MGLCFSFGAVHIGCRPAIQSVFYKHVRVVLIPAGKTTYSVRIVHQPRGRTYKEFQVQYCGPPTLLRLTINETHLLVQANDKTIDQVALLSRWFERNNVRRLAVQNTDDVCLELRAKHTKDKSAFDGRKLR